MLLTNLFIENFEEAREKIRWYQKRWQIECYHKTMKSGFHVEACRLHTVEPLHRFISLVSVLAVRLQAMIHEARLHAKESCEKILDKNERQALFVKVNRTHQLPKKTPTVAEALTWIAILGGYLNRKSDPPPGSMFTWRGWKRLTEITDGWILFARKDVGKS